MAKSRHAAVVAAVAKDGANRIEQDQFARRLHAAMVNKGLSNSDLARAVWGETTDTKGYKVARNRDRIAVYLKGAGMPEAGTLHKLAEVLGVPKEQLAPSVTAAVVDRERPEFAMTMVPGQSGRVHLQMNMLVPLTLAVEVSKLIEADKRPAVPGIDTDDE